MKKELIEALKKLDKAFSDVAGILLDYRFNDDEALNDNYPFELSFDEQAIAVSEWVDAVIENLER